jgi:hypothetical protein
MQGNSHTVSNMKNDMKVQNKDCLTYASIGSIYTESPSLSFPDGTAELSHTVLQTLISKL